MGKIFNQFIEECKKSQQVTDRYIALSQDLGRALGLSRDMIGRLADHPHGKLDCGSYVVKAAAKCIEEDWGLYLEIHPKGTVAGWHHNTGTASVCVPPDDVIEAVFQYIKENN